MVDSEPPPAEQKMQELISEEERAELSELDPASHKKGVMRDLDFISDIPLHLCAELGRTSMIINDLLQLGQGSVIELHKLVGEPLEILVNGKLIAWGEPVVVNKKIGIRVTNILTPLKRVK